MKKLVFDGEFFNVADTLKCGQIFRYESYLDGYRVYSLDKECFVKNVGDKAIIFSDDIEYFYNFFNLDFDYKSVYDFAVNYPNETIKLSAKYGKGIRILKQDINETIFSFLISQNNNIPKITKSLNYMCNNYGLEKESARGKYYSFCDFNNLKTLSTVDFKSSGVGYRAEYLKGFIDLISNGYDFKDLQNLSTEDLYKSLIKIKGIGDKVANCIMLFGYNKYNSFPVDVWIEKWYAEDFKGTLKDRAKISEFFIKEFGNYAGILQQYLFHYKRNFKEN